MLLIRAKSTLAIGERQLIVAAAAAAARAQLLGRR